MDGNGTTESSAAEPRTFEQLLLAGFGWLSLTAEAADDVADDLARRVGIERDAMRQAVRDAVASWRAEAERLGSMPSDASDKAMRRLGLVRREEADDLALRVAQLEHRVRLLETPATRRSLAPRAATGLDGDGETPATDRPAVRDRARRDAPRLRLPDRPAPQQRQHAARRPRPPPARDARRARADVRQVRPAPLDAPGRDAAGHHRRAAQAPGRRDADPVRRRAARDRGGARPDDRAGVPRLRRDADRGGVDRPGAPRDAADRRRRSSSRCSARRRPARSSPTCS